MGGEVLSNGTDWESNFSRYRRRLVRDDISRQGGWGDFCRQTGNWNGNIFRAGGSRKDGFFGMNGSNLWRIGRGDG